MRLQSVNTKCREVLWKRSLTALNGPSREGEQRGRFFRCIPFRTTAAGAREWLPT